jgi:pimeloyl-[acyl-carrier protein] methyl ester esterase
VSVDLYIKNLGRGPALALIHGWGLHGDLWDRVTPTLAANFHLTVPDLPGHGRSRSVPFDTLADLTEPLVSHLRGQAIWVGWSLGALVALTAAQYHPERVEKLVLVGASPCFTQTTGWPWAMTREFLDEFTLELARDHQGALRRFLSLLVGQGVSDRTLLRYLRAEVIRHGAPNIAALLAGLQLLKETDLRSVLPALEIPTLVMHGACDRLVPPEAGRYMAGQMPKAQWVLFDDAGHAPFLSHPELFREKLEAFLHAN